MTCSSAFTKLHPVIAQNEPTADDAIKKIHTIIQYPIHQMMQLAETAAILFGAAALLAGVWYTAYQFIQTLDDEIEESKK